MPRATPRCPAEIADCDTKTPSGESPRATPRSQTLQPSDYVSNITLPEQNNKGTPVDAVQDMIADDDRGISKLSASDRRGLEQWLAIHESKGTGLSLLSLLASSRARSTAGDVDSPDNCKISPILSNASLSQNRPNTLVLYFCVVVSLGKQFHRMCQPQLPC